jgi:glutamine synthetase
VKLRQEVELEAYILHIQIEGRVLGELIYNYILPASVAYQNTLLQNVIGLKDIYGAAHKKLSEGQTNIIEQMAEHMTAIKKKTDAMIDARKKANKIEDSHKKARAYALNIKPYFDEIRHHSDKLEQLVDNQVWPLAKYRELLFIK